MAQLLQLPDAARRAPFVHFDRSELTLLLSLYSRRVAAGEWRDYAIANGPGRAVFAIFRHANERPLYTVAKVTGTGRGGCYVVACGPKPLGRAGDLAEALRVLDRPRAL